MYGEVQVPYTNIGGSNMRSAVALYDLSGSTEEPTPEGQISTTIGVRWSLPGGIQQGGSGGNGFWGYALYSKLSGAAYTWDQDVKDWLLGNPRPGFTPRLNITSTYCNGPFTEEQINEGGQQVINAINNMVRQYVNHLQDAGLDEDFNAFKRAFGSCYYMA